MLRQICQQETDLKEPEIIQLEKLAEQLPLISELTGSDVFLDCISFSGDAIVVAQAMAPQGSSLYLQQVIGQYALPQKEPAVFHAFERQVPVRDIKAITQEGRIVRQDVVPVRTSGGKCIAVLIREKDISESLLQEKKFEELAKTYEEQDVSLRSVRNDDETIMLREIHHRVKNNLQLIASILNLQARRCSHEETKLTLRENVGRVLSIAAIHDILAGNKDSFRTIDSLHLLETLRKNLQSFVPDGKQITMRVSGDAVALSADVASSVALVVNELITNALEHAFTSRRQGEIEISFCAGSLLHTITVRDDGTGFDPQALDRSRLGLRIVQATVHDKLHGYLRMHSDDGGSRISFDFKPE